MKDSGLRFDKNYSMTVFFYKTVELSDSSYIKNPLRSSAFLSIQKDDKCCFLWSILGYLQPIAD